MKNGIILFGDLFDPNLLKQADACVADLTNRGSPVEVVAIPYNSEGNVALQLLAFGLLTFRRYDNIYVLQPEGLCVDARALFLATPSSSGQGFDYHPYIEGQPFHRDCRSPDVALIL